MKLAANKHGEICFKAATAARGYYKRPDATADLIDSEGWLHSGKYKGVYFRSFTIIRREAKALPQIGFRLIITGSEQCGNIIYLLVIPNVALVCARQQHYSLIKKP